MAAFVFIILYELDKKIKYEDIETTTIFSGLKSISGIEDNYLEAATGGVL